VLHGMIASSPTPDEVRKAARETLRTT